MAEQLDKNIALCYSGQIRNFKECFETHLKHIIQANPSYKFYLFFHAWSDINLEGEKYWNEYEERDSWKIQNTLDVFNINPDSMMIEKPIDFKSNLVPDPRFPHPINNTLSMFYSIQASNSLRANFCQLRNIKIDWCLRLRTDLYFLKDLKFNEFKNNDLHINDQYVHTPYAINDLFSFGGPEIMDAYSCTFSSINQLVENNCAINPECFLGYNVAARNIPTKRLFLQNNIYKLYRDL